MKKSYSILSVININGDYALRRKKRKREEKEREIRTEA